MWKKTKFQLWAQLSRSNSTIELRNELFYLDTSFGNKMQKKKKNVSWTSYVTRKWFPLAPCKISWPYEVLCPQKLIFSLGVHIWTPGPLGIQRVKVVLIHVIAILMMSTKLTTPSVLKITIFWNNHEYMLTQTAYYFLNMWCVARFGTICTL